jgi:hypothetical protein
VNGILLQCQQVLEVRSSAQPTGKVRRKSPAEKAAQTHTQLGGNIEATFFEDTSRVALSFFKKSQHKRMEMRVVLCLE